MHYILLFGMPGGGELFFIVLVIIMLFGSKKIPELARGLGKGMKEIKNATNSIQQEIRESTKDITAVKDSFSVEKQVENMINKEINPKVEAKKDEGEDTDKEIQIEQKTSYGKSSFLSDVEVKDNEDKETPIEPAPIKRKSSTTTESQNPPENS